MTTTKQGRWQKEEDEQLKEAVKYYGEKQWRLISEQVPGRSPIQCLHRWSKILKPGLVKGPWSSQEDHLLRKWVHEHGAGQWSQCATAIRGRSGKQCRERWFNILNPEVKKGCWSPEEDAQIFRLYQTFGPRWTLIAAEIPGRTENSIKNRFYSTIRKYKAQSRQVETPQEEIVESDGDVQAVELLSQIHKYQKLLGSTYYEISLLEKHEEPNKQ